MKSAASETPTEADADGRGAYGSQIIGLPSSNQYLGPTPKGAPACILQRREPTAAPRPAVDRLDSESADLVFDNGGWAEVHRATATVTLNLPADVPSAAVVHPYATGSLALQAHWRGALAFHAGALVIDGRAWLVLGEQDAGKSTTLAVMADSGLTVLADDLAVVDGASVFRGPRFVDLRARAALQFASAVDVGHLGARRRWRMPLGAAPWSAPLGGCVVLRWGESFATASVPPTSRLELLFSSLAVREPPQRPEALLDLAAAPMFELRRPRDFGRISELIPLLHKIGATAS